MAIFGLGYNGYKKPLPTLIVIPPSSELPTDVETYRNVAGAGLEIVDVVPDATTANARLESGEVEVVAIAPENARSTFKNGKQSTIEVRVDLADPVQAAYAGLMADQFANAVNREIIQRAVEEGQAEAEQNGVPNPDQIPPGVVAAPTHAELVNIAPVVPTVVAFFGPAVLALILQHMAVTLIALSVVRDRDERRHRGVPGVARVRVGGRRGQDPRVRASCARQSRSQASRSWSSASASRCSVRRRRSRASWRS